MVILHVVAPGAIGGLEGVVESLAAGHQARGHDVHVAVVVELGESHHRLVALLREAGVSVHVIEVPPRGYGLERTSVSELCRLIVPDVVHTHGYRPDVLDAPVARGLGLPTVTTVHGFTRGG